MDLSEIKKIIDLMDENNIAEFEMEREEFKISLKKGRPARVQGSAGSEQQDFVQALSLDELSPADETAQSNTDTIVSPMVGTFYSSSSPESPPFVTAGQEIKENDVLCIVEAMKVMNEIQSEVSGVIKDVLLKNGEPVEFGQALFSIEKA